MFDFIYSDHDCTEYLECNDNHISREILLRKIEEKEIIVLKEFEKIIGWLRFGFFWDNIPFINLLMIEEKYRKKGLGKMLIAFWEKERKRVQNCIDFNTSE